MSEQKQNLLEQSPQTSSKPTKLLHKLWFHRTYWLKGVSAIFMIWFSMLLMYGVVCIMANEFYRFIFLLRNPFIIGFNLLALIAALLHSLMWFNKVPKVMNNMMGQRKLPVYICIAMLWIIAIVVSLTIFYWFHGLGR
ncbi:hypothetical protein RHO15_02570 [Utexia brackfieldae]|uniref:hypothetical protein n=1 Tax=Utexia brackfieldae TaxID=3074108 RepID=UPI00370DD991